MSFTVLVAFAVVAYGVAVCLLGGIDGGLLCCWVGVFVVFVCWQ